MKLHELSPAAGSTKVLQLQQKSRALVYVEILDKASTHKIVDDGRFIKANGDNNVVG